MRTRALKRRSQFGQRYHAFSSQGQRAKFEHRTPPGATRVRERRVTSASANCKFTRVGERSGLVDSCCPIAAACSEGPRL
eukprot:915355-Alexandrium_andersonii.AAC.1